LKVQSMLASITHISALTTIRRERLLPVPGKLIVRASQKVTARDVIAEANLSPQHTLLDIGQGLGLPLKKADEFITRKVGEKVSKGDIIAGPLGVLQRVVRSPVDGAIVALGGGQVLLEVESPTFELLAGIPGTVTQLIPDRGAIIDTTGALVQGVWGNGLIDEGVMLVIARTPDDVIKPDHLDISMRGSVLLAGYCEDAKVLQDAAELPIRGLILSSMASKLLPVALKMQYPLVVLEGFGAMPMNPTAYQILSTNEKREVAINAEVWSRQKGIRPEIVIPLPVTDAIPLPRETDIFAPGQKVHIHNLITKSMTGVITALPAGMAEFPSGIFAQSAVVSLENGEQLNIPLANLDVIE
jgi:hypothetical protein